MKAYENKEKLIKVLKTNIKVWNRYQLMIGIKLSFKINLRSADLRSADLRYADLRYANFDVSSWNLSCKTLSIKKTDIKLRIQLCFHFLKLIENEWEIVSDEEKEIYKSAINYANKFHRNEVERLKSK